MLVDRSAVASGANIVDWRPTYGAEDDCVVDDVEIGANTLDGGINVDVETIFDASFANGAEDTNNGWQTSLFFIAVSQFT